MLRYTQTCGVGLDQAEAAVAVVATAEVAAGRPELQASAVAVAVLAAEQSLKSSVWSSLRVMHMGSL